jgi:hypothetical protein
MAKKADPVKEKAARQKKIAIVGGVLLLGLLAFQVPRTMKMLHGQGNVTPSAATTTATTTPGSTPLAPPSLDGATASSASSTGSGSASSAATSDDGVVDPSTPLPASSGQLISFNRFKSKDPFRQQIEDCGTDSCDAPADSGSGSGSAAGSVGGSASGPGTGSVSGSGSGSGSAPAGPAPSVAKKATVASISVNGVVSKVAVGGTFPSGDPVFRLVALKPKEAEIGISGGSLEGGAAAVGLRLGKTLTLQNTADGARYVLKLVGTA